MYTSKFKDLYAKGHRIIDHDSPEIAFMKHICDGKSDVRAFMNEQTLYKKNAFIDAPNGRFHNLEEMKRFCEDWLPSFHAQTATVHPVIQTISGGRSATEMEVWFQLEDTNETYKVPMAVVCDLAPNHRMEGLRIYMFYKWMPGCPVYRRPVFRPQVNAKTSLVLLTGIVRYYYEQLHNTNLKEALNNILNMCSDDILYGGYRPEEIEPLTLGKEKLKEIYVGIQQEVPCQSYVRFETLIDDGVTCVTEWTTIVRKQEATKDAVCIAGVAMYERTGDGKLGSIRICDNSGFLNEMDFSQVSPEDLFYAT